MYSEARQAPARSTILPGEAPPYQEKLSVVFPGRNRYIPLKEAPTKKIIFQASFPKKGTDVLPSNKPLNNNNNKSYGQTLAVFAGCGTTTSTSVLLAISRKPSRVPSSTTTFARGPLKSTCAFAIVTSFDADRADARSSALALRSRGFGGGGRAGELTWCMP